jgi:hypothetical protein
MIKFKYITFLVYNTKISDNKFVYVKLKILLIIYFPISSKIKQLFVNIDQFLQEKKLIS